MGAYTQPAEYIPAMPNSYAVILDDESLRWAAAESVPMIPLCAACKLEKNNNYIGVRTFIPTGAPMISTT